VMSRNWMPGLGKSGMVRIRARRSSFMRGSAAAGEKKARRGAEVAGS
jgi:hypothetical protein